ncbi:hypothetical protein FRC12_007061 [Ceratobasidium sp. 428]|nr:hypothetical protein FRC12_007061 [Ceratobasidium sp. 428]
MRVVEGRVARGIPLSRMQPLVATDAPEGTLFTVSRKQEYGGSVHFSSEKQLDDAFAAKEVHPGDLKAVVADAVVSLLEPIQKAFEGSEEWKEKEKLAYPPPVVEVKKKKEKVYHPPPPGKGKKAAQAVDPNAPQTELSGAGPTPESTAQGLEPEEATSIQTEGSSKAS